MTLIGATTVRDKWTLLSDDAITLGQTRGSAQGSYRGKIREIKSKNVDFYFASCGAIKDIDFSLNNIEKRLAKTKFKNTNEITYLIQEIVSDNWRELKTLTDSPAVAFIILAPKLNIVWAVDEYCVTRIEEGVNIVFGSADQSFYECKDLNFFAAFKMAVATDVYCDFPLTSIRDGEVKKRYFYDKEDDFYKYNSTKDEHHTQTPACFEGAHRPDGVCRSTNTKL